MELTPDLKQTIADIEKGRDPNDFPPDLLFSAQVYFSTHDQKALVLQIANAAKRRMEEKGFIKCDMLGWFPKSELGAAGLGKQGNDWKVMDSTKFFAYLAMLSREKKERHEAYMRNHQAEMNV